MKILFSPQRRDDVLALEKIEDDVLSVNGNLFDFSTLNEGDTIPADEIPCDWIVGSVSRIGGVIHVTVILPHGPNPSRDLAFPQPIFISNNGHIMIPSDPDPIVNQSGDSEGKEELY